MGVFVPVSEFMHAYCTAMQTQHPHQESSTMYSACVLTTLLYGSESWTLHSRGKKERKKLNAFHKRSLQQILGILWSELVPNTEVLTHVHRPYSALAPLARAHTQCYRREDPQGPGYHSIAKIDDFLNYTGPI